MNFSDITITPIVFKFRSRTPVELNGYMCDTVRRTVETSLKTIDDRFEEQNLKAIPYFRNEIPVEILEMHPELKDFKTPPRGYSLALSTDTEQHILKITLNLFGRYVEIYPQLMEQIPTRIRQNKALGLQLMSITDVMGGNLVVGDDFRPMTIFHSVLLAAEAVTDELKIDFLSPTKFNQRHRIYGGMWFEAFYKALLERAALIGFLYCGETFRGFPEPPETAGQILVYASNLTWIESATRTEKNPIDGYVGSVVYKAPKRILKTVLPLLLLGQWLHAGQKTNWGAGQYVVDQQCYTIE